MYKKYKDGGPISPRYKKKEGALGTAEERLVGALQSQGVGAEGLMYLLSSMRSPSDQERMTAMFSDQPEYAAPGRAYRTESGAVRYQPPSDIEGEYLGEGRRITKEDVAEITGGRAETKDRGQIAVAKMLEDPAVLRYFMDIYGKAGEAFSPRLAKISRGKGSEDCQPDRTGKIPASCKGQKDAYN